MSINDVHQEGGRGLVEIGQNWTGGGGGSLKFGRPKFRIKQIISNTVRKKKVFECKPPKLPVNLIFRSKILFFIFFFPMGVL